jgi:hypothetical protein
MRKKYSPLLPSHKIDDVSAFARISWCQHASSTLVNQAKMGCQSRLRRFMLHAFVVEKNEQKWRGHAASLLRLWRQMTTFIIYRVLLDANMVKVLNFSVIILPKKTRTLLLHDNFNVTPI